MLSAHVCKHSKALVVVSGFGAYAGYGSQVGQVTGFPFLQSLLQFSPCMFFRQEKFWVKNFEGRRVILYFHWGPCHLLVVSRFSLQTVAHFG